MNNKKGIAILGSTGSIGTQALDVIRNHKDKFEIIVLTAENNSDLLIRQAKEFKPDSVVIGNKEKYKEVSEALKDDFIKVFAGKDALNQIVEHSAVEIVLTAMVGYSGLIPTINAIKAKKNIALANKETLVVAGELINKLVHENQVQIIPVDSEHSAIFQCLVGEIDNKIENIYLTASGGPFREKNIEDLINVTALQALNHPIWNMGAKISIDSASMINKGFEAIEAKWLFDLKPEQIEIIVHPQSIIHSIVQFEDGSMKAQMGLPDMRLPIQYAFSYPNRIKSNFNRFSFSDYANLTFEPANSKKFRNLAISFDAMKKGGNVPCIMNAANEIAVDAFLNNKINFLNISDIIEQTIDKVDYKTNLTIEDYIYYNNYARDIANQLINNNLNK
ncbi:MAG: 1-deoxy-D-xylulose-5-phosphate reductoisomerase [Bacteroidales bacterium]|nr:1-deoxy-D-xylulose-5-phosphate reductoisomerase [Bacteroidales bacterium]MBN2757115.1 1-deoxy-D-xylulose-5-phosphate reductoisomerase [Bacteroidales bacterium]